MEALDPKEAKRLQQFFTLPIPRTYASLGDARNDVWSSVLAGFEEDAAMHLAIEAAVILQGWLKEAYPDVRTVLVAPEDFMLWCGDSGTSVPEALRAPFDFIIENAKGAAMEAVSRAKGQVRWNWKRTISK